MPILRWFLVVPAAVVGGVLITFPMHWLVMINLGGCSSEPIIEIRDRDTLKSIELFLQGFLCPFAFVYAGAYTAPSRKLAVSVVLAIVVVVSGALIANWLNSAASETGVTYRYGVIQFLSNLAGASGAILLVRYQQHSCTAGQAHQ